MLDMEEIINLQNYLTYLSFINQKITKFFEQQKPFICCKKGCAKCCKNAQFPYSEIELRYLLYGYCQLSENKRNAINKNLEEVLKQKKEFKGEKFRYTCPFLLNDTCAVYDYRGILCRTFGLMENASDGKIKAPFCTYEGLNYANVFDYEKNNISPEKYEEGKFTKEPLGYNVGYLTLTDPDFERGFNFTFGEKKPLVDWFEELYAAYFNKQN